jgi:maltose alpha-D-glucosyltransferase/alpha-amylase
VGGNTKFYGAALFRLRREDFGELRHYGGVSPAWPISYDDLEPYYTQAENLYQVHGQRGEDPTDPPSSAPYPYPAVSHEPRLQHLSEDFAQQGLRPFHTPLGIMLDEANPHASKCIRCSTCDGYPCLVHAKSDAEVIAVDPAVAHQNVTLVTKAYVERLETDNPEVQQAMLAVVSFWLDLGIDGFRVDAVPYLFEREETNCENLAETHDFLKRLRKFVDERYPHALLLAEANQWPDDVVEYFGDGDEFHMGYHFPIMPRLFMALRQEDRRPIVEILERTPHIPVNCQWGMFLRNHDELTLEMVTDEERDYLYSEYARDRRMRLNVGIRRRLAPLMDNGRRRIELLHALLFSLPGSPFLYYGDEIGMGDNIYLGDRDGVRTPMQWSADRNAGFSQADFARLYFPLIMDPVYGFQAVNVEAQQRYDTSLLNWMREIIRLRKEHPVFGRGALGFIKPENRKVFAFTRSYRDETVLCVFNLAQSAQPVELNLKEFEGSTPIEMMGGTAFPSIGSGTYQLALAPRGFYWFLLSDKER